MYSNSKNTGFNWKGIFLKLILIILFIVLLLWIITKFKKMNGIYNNVFSDDIKRMKESGKDYFTSDKLPNEIGESIRISLKELEETNSIVPFKDKDGKDCDKDASYIEVTKKESNYLMTVKLICPKQEGQLEFILENGNICPVNPNPEKKPDDKKIEYEDVTEYEYRKLSTNTKTYSCPSDYNLSGTKCIKKVIKEQKEAKKNYYIGKIITESAKRNTGSSYKQYIEKIEEMYYTYNCTSGYNPIGTGADTICTKTITLTKLPKCDTGSDLTGTGINILCKKPETESSTKYLECKNGNLVIDGAKTTCKIETPSIVASTCPTGFEPSTTDKTKCIAKEAKKVDAQCSDGYQFNGTQCEGTKPTTTNGQCSYGTPSGLNCTYSPTYKTTTSTKTISSPEILYDKVNVKYDFIEMIPDPKCNTSCPEVWYKYKETTTKKVATCPKGGKVSGSKCVISNAATCPSGYNPSGTSCVKNEPVYESLNCNKTGGTLDGTSCILDKEIKSKICSTELGYNLQNDGTCKKIDVTTATPTCSKGTYNKSTGKCDNIVYSYTIPKCDTGYDLVEGICTKPENVSKLPDAILNYKYSCPGGYTRSGTGKNTLCYKEVKSKDTYYCERAEASLTSTRTCIYKEPDKFLNYSCESSKYTLNGNYCYIFAEETINATVKNSTTTTYEYKWSTSDSLSGWEKTGNTRTKKVVKKTSK